VTDLSGITWEAEDRFWAVSDKKRALVPVQLKIDPASGQITAGEIGALVPVKTDLGDFEGVAWAPRSKRLYISGETGSGLRSFSLTGLPGPAIKLPPIFGHRRSNLGMESLTCDAARRVFWTANEEALPEDGAVTGPENGTLVRIHCCDSAGKTVHQYAWRTEAAKMRYGGAGNGVSDLCALPNGDLLVLERGFGTFGLQCRIFRADFREATDVRAMSGLAAGTGFIAARKELLFQQASGFTNYEGITLGPALAGGWHSLVLVADSNGGPRHAFLALRVRWDKP
jgi:hypothetical protein